SFIINSERSMENDLDTPFQVLDVQVARNSTPLFLDTPYSQEHLLTHHQQHFAPDSHYHPNNMPEPAYNVTAEDYL
ncbi:hypothetical protein FRC17_008460, partial [Serendipita sp. 399]